MSNETISKWLGEHRCLGDIFVSGGLDGNIVMCSECKETFNSRISPNTDYENDESAWTQELYGKIEEAGLEIKFAHELYNITSTVYRIAGPFFWKGIFEVAQSSPPQKALALSRSIEEIS